jgi:HprK-related kinase A
MRHAHALQIGPVRFRVGSAWRAPIETLRALYAGYPAPEIGEFTVRLCPERPLRRWVRPSIAIEGDYTLPESAPLALAHGLLAAEMGMNLQMALGHRRHLLLHAAALERDGKALLLSGASGAGKSTLAALLGERGWRLMGDEFALIDLADGRAWPFPRAVSLKNNSIGVLAAAVAPDRFGPELAGTPKGTIRHLRPRADAIAGMSTPAPPALLLFPRFGETEAVRTLGAAEVFVRLTQASTNYVALGEAGFETLTRLVRGVPARAIDYPDTAGAIRLVTRLWDEFAA